MPRTRTAMRRIREVLRLKFQLGLSETQVASGAGIARTTVQDYLRRIAACGTNHDQLLALDEAALERRLFPPREPRDSTRPVPDWESIERELRGRRVTLRLVWLEYLAENRGGYQYTQFLRHFHAWQAASRPPVMRFLAEIRPNKRIHACQAAFGWMRAVLQKDVDLDALRREMVDVPDVEVLVDRLYYGSLAARNRAMVVLANHHGLKSGAVCAFLGINKKTQRKYLRNFEDGGHTALFARQTRSSRKHDDWALRQAVFRTLHEPPANYGINRTTWIMRDLSRVLRDAGQPAGHDVIRKIIKAAGYRWRKARKVLTSNDPDYRQKVRHIQQVLSGLKDNEAFFSIDEFGPFSIRAYGGRALVGPNEMHTIPQHQKQKGSLIMTAALELSKNQITHFYSPRKDTGEMLRMLARLLDQYKYNSRIYLSWDAASWHISKMLRDHVERHNENIAHGVTQGPTVALAPLPSGAQFLNVIESVFSGMARAIIANSDYQSMEEARAAIDRYILERNEKFVFAPKRAGRAIWGAEREPPQFSESNNCKDPLYR